jgi:tRNA(Ile)-lysidine synthase
VSERSDIPPPDQTVLRAFPTNLRYLVGVSGGRDSVALLDWLVRSGYRDLVVCHFNHQLRSRASTTDARFVEKLAAKLSLEAVVGANDVRKLARANKMSIEAAARFARYRFFAQTARRRHCRTLLLAHHADDLVETFLINLLRGAGSAGLAGIRESSQHKIANVQLRVIRPFLRLWRRDIDRYVRRHRLPFREDASNSQLGPLRNRIRLRVIPYLQRTVGRDIRQNIWRTAMIVAEEEQFFSELLPEIEQKASEMSLRPLRQMAIALQRRTLHKWLRNADVADVGFDLVERVRGLLDVAAGAARTNLPRNRHVRRRAGKLLLE